MAESSSIGDWFNNVWERILDVGSALIKAGIDLLPIPSPSEPSPTVPPPSGTGGGGGGTTTSPGSGSGSPTGGNGYFTDTIRLLKNLGKRDTWFRVGLVFLGIVLVVIALRMMVLGKSPIEQVMDDIGV